MNPAAPTPAFDQAINLVMTGMRKSGVHGAVGGFKQAIDVMSRVRYDRSHPRPQVLIVGEYLLNFHPAPTATSRRTSKRTAWKSSKRA